MIIEHNNYNKLNGRIYPRRENMSTDPIENILPRQLDEKLNEILSDFSELIDEIVNYSTHVLSWTFQKKEQVTNIYQ